MEFYNENTLAIWLFIGLIVGSYLPFLFWVQIPYWKEKRLLKKTYQEWKGRNKDYLEATDRDAEALRVMVEQIKDRRRKR